MVHVPDQLEDLCRVTVFVVIECDQLEELVVQLDSFSGIEDRCMRICDEVAGKNFVINILDNALHRSFFGSFLDLSADLFIACRLF